MVCLTSSVGLKIDEVEARRVWTRWDAPCDNTPRNGYKDHPVDSAQNTAIPHVIFQELFTLTSHKVNSRKIHTVIRK